MAKNYIRQVNQHVNAMARAKERALRENEEYIRSAFADGREQADFRFDAFSMWSKSRGKAEAVFAFLEENDLGTDNWLRGVFSLSQEQAVILGRLVTEWNAEWEYAISHDMIDYNAFNIGFGKASGREHVLTVNAGTWRATDSWQWNG